MGATLWELGPRASVRSTTSLARVVNLLPPLPKTFANRIKAKAVGRKALGAHKRYSLGHKADCSSILWVWNFIYA